MQAGFWTVFYFCQQSVPSYHCTVAMRKPKQHVRKASHCASKQQ